MNAQSDSPWLAKAVAVGVVAGMMSGLFGVGGGTVLVPALVLLLGLTQHRAHATSLAAIALTAPAAMLGFALGDAVAFRAGLVIAVGGFAGAYVGAGLMHRVSEARLTQGFALLTLVVAVRLLVGDPGAADAEPVAAAAWALLGYGALGVVSGTLSALMGVGGGVILVPALVLFFGFDQHLAEGTSLLVIVPTAVVGAARHHRHGYTDWRLGLVAGLGGVAGGLGGAQVALALEAALLQRLFAVFLAVIAARLLVQARRAARGA